MRGKAANSRATIAARKTNEPTINTRRTIGEAFDLVTPANQSLGRLIPRCTRSRVPVPLCRPSAADQTMPDSGKLSKRPFRKNSICTQMKATNWSHPRLRVSFLPHGSTLRSRPNVACYSVSLGQRTRVVVIAPTSGPARARPTHLCVNYPLLCPSSLLTAFFILLFPP